MTNLPVFLFVAVGCIVCCALATDEVRDRTFYDSLMVSYGREYRDCTGSTGFVDPAFLIDWKKKMDALALTSAYIELAREYRKSVDSVHIPLPCKVLAWNEQRKKAQIQTEDLLTDELWAQQEAEDARREIDTMPKSAADCGIFPFGISRRTLVYMYKKAFGSQPVDMQTHLYVNDMQWGERRFLTAFYFDTNNRFVKYEIESASQPSNRLNSEVRPDAEYLSLVFAKKLGEPSRRYTFGIFDIKSGVLSPYKTWDVNKGYSAYVGISVENYRYYAKAVIAKIPPRAPASPKPKPSR